MRINAKPSSRRLFRLRTILLVVMLSVLLLPVASVYLFRFYENELVRRTEAQLIDQSAALAAVFRELRREPSALLTHSQRQYNQDFYTPISPILELSTQTVLPRRDVARTTQQAIAAKDWQVGLRMQNILLNTQRYTLAGMRVLDAKGIVIAGRSEVGQSLSHVLEVRNALSGNYRAVIRERISDEPPPPLASISRGTGIRVFTAFPVIEQGEVLGVIYLSRTPQNILKHMYQIRGKLTLLGLLLLFVTGLLVLFISSRLSRPIRELIEQTQHIARGERNTIAVLKQPGTYELAQLSQSFAEMSEALHERSIYIDRFASHVSHEFKTPLTAMQGALELLQEHADDMPPEQRKLFLDNLYEDTQRLRRLVSRLLEQARADALQPSAEGTRLYPILIMLRSRYIERSLVIKSSTQAISEKQTASVGPCLNIAPVALETVLGNLFENSLQHGANQVDINWETDQSVCRMIVQDNGRGISKANQDKVFTPFFTTQREQGGTGLGLGIVQSLLQTWKGSIRLLESEQGVRFEITLKLVQG